MPKEVYIWWTCCHWVISLRHAITLLMLVIFTLQPVLAAQNVSTIGIKFEDDFSAYLNSDIIRIIHQEDLQWVQGVVGAPLIPELYYSGELIIGPQKTGVARMAIIPTLEDKKAVVSYLINKSIISPITLHTLMTFIFPDGIVITNVRYDVGKNGTMIIVQADAQMNNPYIKLYNLTFYTTTIGKTININYAVKANLSSLKGYIIQKGDYEAISLSPILTLLPKDVVGIIDVAFPEQLHITGGSPAPKQIIWNEAKWQYSSNLMGKDIEVYFSEIAPPPNPILLWFVAMIPPILIGLFVAWKIRKNKRR